MTTEFLKKIAKPAPFQTVAKCSSVSGQGKRAVDPVLRNCWFWLAQYGPTAVVPHCRSSWTLWQYTDGGVGPPPHNVPGIGNCDRDMFNGDDAQLRSWWGK